MKKIKIAILLLMSLLVVGCAKSEIEVFRFVNNKITIQVGEPKLLELIYGEFKEDSEVIYTMSEENIVSLNDNEVLGINPGEVTITATIDNVKFAKVVIEVINRPISSMKIDAPKNYIYFGEAASEQMILTCKTDGVIKPVTWSIEDSDYSDKTGAEISGDGKLKVLREPTVQEHNAGGIKVVVVATSVFDPTMSAKIQIYVKYAPTTNISVSADRSQIKIGESTQLYVTVSPANASKFFTYTSRNVNVAIVSETGLVTSPTDGIVGETIITVKTIDGKLMKTITIEVIANE